MPPHYAFARIDAALETPPLLRDSDLRNFHQGPDDIPDTAAWEAAFPPGTRRIDGDLVVPGVPKPALRCDND